MVTAELPTYESLKFRVGDGGYTHVYEVRLSRPSHRNAFHETLWLEFYSCIRFLDNLPSCRCIIITAEGPVFSGGIDLAFAATLLHSPVNFVRKCTHHAQDSGRTGGKGDTSNRKFSAALVQLGSTANEVDSEEAEGPNEEDCARKAFHLQRGLRRMQDTFTSLEECSKPIIVCVTGACIGAAVDLICACDIRLASQEAWFTVKEVDLGIAADLGTLQRLPRVVGNDSWVRDVCFTGRIFHAAEAKKVGFLSDVFKTREILFQQAWTLAATIATKSPVAVLGTKVALNNATRRSVSEELKLQSIWNSAMLQTVDIPLALSIEARQKQEEHGQSPTRAHMFSNL